MLLYMNQKIIRYMYLKVLYRPSRAAGPSSRLIVSAGVYDVEKEKLKLYKNKIKKKMVNNFYKK
jgi:hypothetical protein